MKPLVVTFDFWNTLYYESRERSLRDVQLDELTEGLAHAGLDVQRSDVAEAYDEAWGTFLDCWRRNRPFTVYDATLHCAARLAASGRSGRNLEILVRDAFLRGSREAEFVVIDGARDFLELLKRHGIGTAIVCDVGFTPSYMLRERLRVDGLFEYVDAFAFSDEVGCFKPDQRLFEHGVCRFACSDPRRIVHVGDGRRTDVVGARRMGFVAVRFAAIYDDLVESEGPSGDFVVRSYTELASVVSLDASGLGGRPVSDDLSAR